MVSGLLFLFKPFAGHEWDIKDRRVYKTEETISMQDGHRKNRQKNAIEDLHKHSNICLQASFPEK